MNLPTELIRDPRERNSWIGGVWFPFFKFTDQATVRYFNVFLGYNPVNYPTVLDYIYSNIRLAEHVFPDPKANILASQTSITKITKPEVLVQRNMGKIECINEFWKYVDEVYLIEPKTDQARSLFDLQGIAHSVFSEHDDDIESPFGLYVAKFIDGVPLVLHFVWASRDEDVFFKDKPYSVFDVLWSIRFDILR